MRILTLILTALISTSSIAGQSFFNFYNYNLDVEERVYDVDGLTWEETEKYIPKIDEARDLFKHYKSEGKLSPIEALSEVLFVIISSETEKTFIEDKLGEGTKNLEDLI